MTIDEMKWDLSQLVEGTDPVVIEKKLESMVAEAENIRHRYHSKIVGLEAKGLVEFLEMKDAYTLKFEGVEMYCRLIYYADSTDACAKQLNDVGRRAALKVGQALAFIEIELGKLLAKKPSLAKDPMLAEYKHYLERLLARVPHMLSETEERLIIAKDKSGVKAWEMLQSEWLSTRTFNIKIGGKMKILSYDEIIGLYQSPDRDLREQAYQTVYDGLGKDEIIWTSAIRAICEDHMQVCELRRYSNPMIQSLIANDVDQQIIDSLMKVVEKDVGLYQRYLKLKAQLMGLDKLANYDLAAPLPYASKIDYAWKEARKEITDTYIGFDEQVGGWVNEMYERRHIDGGVRKGKASGAFSATWFAGKTAYILQSFNGKIRDVYTQAHELGHAVHAYLGSRAQKLSNFEIGSCIAEIGSTFGELLLAERLFSKAKTKEEKQAILANILDEFGVAVFKVSSYFFFEQSLYDAIKRGEFLDGECVSKLWIAARSRIYGDSIDWLEVAKWEWTRVSHYYMANYRFYNYPYIFAQLFVYALYHLYKEQGERFVPKLKKLLAAGSSKSPRELCGELGFDIADEEFWEKGIKQAEKFVDMLEESL